MAVKIKLTRVGMKKQPTYRVVIQEARSKRDGRFIENLGFYNPRTSPPTITVDAERVNYWLGKGAQPTDSVGRLLKIAGITDKYYRQRKQTVTAQPGEESAELVGEAAGEAE
jgi:small subunit ribosomal protein S16